MATPISEIQQQIKDIKKQIEILSRRLQLLQEQAARYGVNVPPEVALEIEDLEKEKLPSLQERLQRLRQQELAVSAKKARLSDRLVSDYHLAGQFHSFKEKWSEVAKNMKLLPGLAKDWSEYADAIDQYASDIIPQNWGTEDIFILCCAIYLHKIGLFPTNRTQTIKNIFDQYPRLSKEYILELGHVFELDLSHMDDIAWVCYGHRNLINDDKSIENTMLHPELLIQTRKGRENRAEIAYYLKILSLLGAFDISLPRIVAVLHFMDTKSDYYEYRMNSVVASFEIWSPLENAERSILLKARLSDVDLIEDIRFLQMARDNLDNAIKDSPNRLQDNYFLNTSVEIDDDVFAAQLENKVLTVHFAKKLQEAIRKSVMALLDSRYGEGNPFLKGWGPHFFYPKGANPDSRYMHKNSQEARVANTAEVLLAFAGWLDNADPNDVLIPKVIEVINEVLPSLQYVQVRSIEGRSAASGLGARISSGVKGADTILNQYNPLASLTFVVPTTRANSLFILAGASLLKEMEKYPGLNGYRQVDCQLMKDCIDWLCNTETGPFSEKTIRYLPSEYIFQTILGLRALINSKEYWKTLQIGFDYQQVVHKIAEFVHSLLQHHEVEKTWSTVYKAMVLEILLFYREQADGLVFHQKAKVTRLISNFIQDLLDEVKLDNALPWKEDHQTLIDEDRKHSRPWTHVTSVWAVEGLYRCMHANLLTTRQKGQLLQTLPLILLNQNEAGFYASVPHPDDPENTTVHFIFRTALYTYALTQIQKVFPELQSNNRND